MLKKRLNYIWLIGCEITNIIFASNLGYVRIVLLFFVGITPTICSEICSYLKEKEKTTQVKIHEQEETKRTNIAEKEKTKRAKIQSSVNSNEIEKITDILLRNNNSLPPDELRKQNIDNLIYYNEFLKQRNNKAFSKIKYQAETSLPAYNTSIQEEKPDDIKGDDVYKLFLQFITSIKDDIDENKT